MHRAPLNQTLYVLCLWALFCCLVTETFAAEPDGTKFVRPEYQILRAAGLVTIDGKLDEPSWIAAPAVGDFVFPWWRSGPKEQTVAKLLWDDRHLYVACICSDQHITARVTERDGPVNQDDCLEVMLAPNPERPEVYFNIEWNVIGGIVDNFRPHGPQQPRAPKWDARGVQVSGSFVGTINDDSNGDRRWIVEVAIPFTNFAEYSPSTPPRPGSAWNLNLNRHGGATNPQYSQWSAGDTAAPAFHTPHRFGRVLFSDEVVPTGQARRFAFPPLEAIARMQTPEGVLVTPFAAEPNIRQPILVKCDDRGRLWVIQYLQYPNPAGLQRVKVDRYSRTVYDRMPDPPPRGPRGADKITICEDTDADGQADKFTDFVDGLNLCTGLAFGHGGVFVLQVPYLLFYADRDRDDVPDGEPDVLLAGFGMEDAQSFANHLTWGPDGWLYGVNGSTTTCSIRGVEFQQGVWRYQPRTREFELFCEGGGNLFGLTFDRHGQMLFTSNGGDLCMHGIQGAYYRKAFGKHGPLHNPHAYGFFVDIHKTTPVVGGPCTSGTVYLADGLPDPLAGSFLCGDFLGHTCSWWQLHASGSTFAATRGGTLLAANDPWFGATDVCYGPDGAVYVSDFHDRRTAHPDPDADWDRTNGRVYRLSSATSRPAKSLDLARLTSPELVELLRHPSGWFRERARLLLAERRDSGLQDVLRELAIHSGDAQLALESLWSLYGIGGFDGRTAAKLLAHSDEHVRQWTIRFVGETPELASALSQPLTQLAAHDPSVLVRAQFAATAQRLPGTVALPVITALLERNLDAGDPHIPWLIWWALENKALTDRQAIVDYFSQPSRWESPLARDNLLRLMRRYATEGSAVTYAVCIRLLDATPESHLPSMLNALSQGLAERAAVVGGIGLGELFRATGSSEPVASPTPARTFEPIPADLRQRVEQLWNVMPDDLARTRLAILAGVDTAYDHLVSRVSDETQLPTDREQRLQLLAEFGRDDCASAVLPLFSPAQPERIQLAALRVLQRFDQPAIAARLAAGYLPAPPAVRTVLSDVLLSRSTTALALLRRVDLGEIPAVDIPIGQLRRVSQHRDPLLDELVRKHWGRIRSATPEEKLAVMRRLSNDLRVERGDARAGKPLFQKHCGTCHQLFGEGEKVGPDLTNTSRQDTEYLLASLVDPSAVVRREYAASTLVTTGGQVLTGLILEQANGRVTIVDGKGQRQPIAQSEIAELREADTSLMPEGLPLLFTPRELRELFGYIQSAP